MIFTIGTFNILAQTYIRHEQFPLTPRHLLKWKRRRQDVVAKLENLADILCLQEVDRYEEFYHGQMKKRGWHIAWKRRTGDRKIKHDGCAVMWRDQWTLIRKMDIELNDVGNMENIMSDLEDKHENERWWERDNVGLCVLLECDSGRRIIVCTAHLFWNEKYADLKVIQAWYLRRRILEFAESVQQHSRKLLPIILAGDFNSLPLSPVLQLLESGEFNGEHQSLLSDQAISYLDKTTPRQQHRFTNIHASSSEDHLTTITPKFSGALDHIFVRECEDIESISPIPLPTKKELSMSNVRALPNVGYPSDHLPVTCKIKLTSCET